MGLLSWLLGNPPNIRDAPEIPAHEATPAPSPQPPAAPVIPPPGDYRFVVIDVETANGWNGSICQIGLAMITLENRIETFSTLIDPECEFSAFNVDLHGIDQPAVAGKPTFRYIAGDLAALLARQPVVQHSNFDRGAVMAVCEQQRITLPAFEWFDSVQIARRAWPELLGSGGGHGLANLKQALRLTFDHHDAGEDARAAAMVVLLAEETTGHSFRELASNKRDAPPRSKHVTRAGAKDAPLSGMIVVFTGALNMSRDDAANLAAARGLTVKASVTLQTNLVVVGEQDLSVLAGHTKSSKHRKAEDLIAAGHPIRIIGEDDFLAMCDG